MAAPRQGLSFKPVSRALSELAEEAASANAVLYVTDLVNIATVKAGKVSFLGDLSFLYEYSIDVDDTGRTISWGGRDINGLYTVVLADRHLDEPLRAGLHRDSVVLAVIYGN